MLHSLLLFPASKMHLLRFLVFFGTLCLLQHAVTTAESNATSAQVKEAARTALDADDLEDADSPPLIPASHKSFLEVALTKKSAEAPVARASSYGTYGKSFIGLGDSCSSDDDCSHLKTNVLCSGGVCRCGARTVKLANVACLRRAKHLGDKCILSEQCKNLDPLATCYQDRCMCEPIYHVAGDIGGPASGSSSVGRQDALIGCLKKRNLGESCQDTLQCAYKVANSYCDSRSHTCRCNFGFTPTGDDTCGPLADALGQPCIVNAQCANLMHAYCGNSGTCQCEDGERFVQVQTAGSDRRKRRQASGAARLQMCLPAVDLGQQCSVSAQCKKRTRNADCIGGSCQCVSGFVQRDPFVNECLPLIKGIGKHSPPCTISAQCLQKNSYCNKTTDHCDCDKAHCTVGYKCLPKVWHEEKCEKDCQCQTPNTVCKEGWCQCRKGTCFSELAKLCLPKTLQFNANPFEFVAPCCGDLSRDRCFGQLTFAPTFLNCSSKPKFTPRTCGSDPTIIVDEFGGLRLSGSTSSSSFNSNNQNHQPQQQDVARRQVTSTTTCTFTAETKDGLWATASVIIKPEACCTQIPSATVSTAAINLAVLVPGPCLFALAPVLPNTVTNGAFLLDFDDLFNMPCGEQPVITSAIQMSATGFGPGPPTGRCMVNANNQLQFEGMLAAGTTAQCVISTTTLGCNGQDATSLTTFNLICPPMAAVI